MDPFNYKASGVGRVTSEQGVRVTSARGIGDVCEPSAQLRRCFHLLTRVGDVFPFMYKINADCGNE